MLGSLCPVTLGHVQAFVEARRLLLGEECAVARPKRLERFDAVLGRISLNGSRHVNSKLQQKGESSLGSAERLTLVHLAIADLPWMGTEQFEGASFQELERARPDLHLTHFVMNGADDVRRYHKWDWAARERPARWRMITMGRPGDTEYVEQQARRAKIDLDEGLFVMGPTLPDISSTAARAALRTGDAQLAATMLHPDVLSWCQAHGPWGPNVSD